MKILIVDDDPQILDALSVGFGLQWEDAQVSLAKDGEEGLRLFFDRLPDVVLLDIVLPQKNGFEVLREIRKVSDVPIIVLTARGTEPDQVRGLELGADDYVVKPFCYMALIARIKAVMRRAQMPPPPRNSPDFVAGELAVDFESSTASLGGKPLHLTPTEYKLLSQLARNEGRLMKHIPLVEARSAPRMHQGEQRGHGMPAMSRGDPQR